MAEKRTVAGRTFLVIQESTLAQDLYFQGLLAETGIDDIVKGAEESAEHYARRLLDALVGNCTVLDMLGTLLIPEDKVPEDLRERPGEAWTKDVARETAAWFGSLTGDHKAQVRGMITTLLQDFLEAGLVSLQTSTTSSPGEENPAGGTGPLVLSGTAAGHA